jgi:hypothetical protein
MSDIERIARLKISLEEIEPVIWRQVELPVTSSLKAVHDVIQAAFGWEDYHLFEFEFEVGGRRYGVPAPEFDREREVLWARNVKLQALIAKGHTRFGYTYDFGDDWRHEIVIEAIEDGAPDTAYPRLVTGERRGPPEDVGGPYGYYDFLDAMADPAHENHADMLAWYGGPFDPEDMDRTRSAWRVGRLAVRRRAGKEAYEKSRRSKAT